MKLIALVSGGKDSILSMLECVRMNHEIVCIANLYPIKNTSDIVSTDVTSPPQAINDEIDSHCFQTVGTHAVENIAACFQGGIPLRTAAIHEGQSINRELEYTPAANIDRGTTDVIYDIDEVEVLFNLLKSIKEEFTDVKGVCSGAILSTYQRLRVENVCERLGLISIAPLWQLSGQEVFRLLTKHNVNAILIKVSTMGLDPRKYLGKSLLLPSLQKHLLSLEEQYEVHPAGEGGEFETLVLDCPLFYSQRLMVAPDSEVIMVDDNPVAPTGRLAFRTIIVDKETSEGAPDLDGIKSGASSDIEAEDNGSLVRAFHSCYLSGFTPQQMIEAAEKEFGMDEDRLVDCYCAGNVITDAIDASTALTTSRVECRDEEAVLEHISALFAAADSGGLKDVSGSDSRCFNSIVTSLVSFSTDSHLSEEKQVKRLIAAALKATTSSLESLSYKRLLFVLIYSPMDITHYPTINKAYSEGFRIGKNDGSSSSNSAISNVARAFICVTGLKVITLSLVYGVARTLESEACDQPNVRPILDSFRIQSISGWSAASIGPYPQALGIPLVSDPKENLLTVPSYSSPSSIDDVQQIVTSVFISGRIGMDPFTLDICKPSATFSGTESDTSPEFRRFVNEFFHMVANVISVVPVMMSSKATVDDAKMRLFGGWSNSNKDENGSSDSVSSSSISIFVTKEKHVPWAHALFRFVLWRSSLYSSVNYCRIPKVMIVSELPKKALVEMITFLPAPAVSSGIRVNGRAMDPFRFCIL